MARQEIYVDDLDGSKEGVKVVKFGVDGTNYEIDLGPANHAKLRDALAPFVAKATKIDGRASGRGTRTAGVRRAGGAGDQKDFNAKVRKWAQDNGHAVKDRGRVPAEIVEAYKKATGN